jgi:hypothetical protein
LHERIALTGPRDEFRELADTLDAVLDRFEDVVASQGSFVANDSHELRTPARCSAHRHRDRIGQPYARKACPGPRGG